MGKLTTHVLDTASGRPAAGVRIELYRHPSSQSRVFVTNAITDADGRCDSPLLAGVELEPGEYEILFHIGDYFRNQGAALSEPPFLDVVPIRVGLADATAHYHVPLLVSPWAYSTYRGS